MNRITAALLCLFILASAFVPVWAEEPSSRDAGQLKKIAQFEGGTLYANGPVKVVELKGTYRQMGRQYGHLMGKDLKKLYRMAIVEEYMGNQKFTQEQLKEIAYSLYNIYPMRYREIFKGMAETSGLTEEQVIFLNAVEFFPKIKNLIFKCSGMAVWGDYSKDGSVIFGRNNDDSPFFTKFGPFVSVTVLKPDDGSNPTAIVNYSGAFYAANGFNSKGVFLELNAGNPEGFYLTRPSIFVSLLSYLQDMSTMEQIGDALLANRANISSIINMADPKRAYSYECSCNCAKRCVGDKEGIIVSTNHFVNPDWGIAGINDKMMGWTIKRRDNLLALGEKFKGQFDENKMMEVFDTTIDNGGATPPGAASYQIVAVPAKFVMWLKAPGSYDWTKADLSKILAD